MDITPDLIEKLSSDEITVKESKKIIEAIGDKVNIIWRFIIEASGRELDWWAFSNDVSYGHGNGSYGGSFDPDTDKEWIEIGGKSTACFLKDYAYDSGFPTSFLWEDYETIVTEHIKTIKEKESQHKLQKQKKRQTEEEMVKAIKTKLTSDELKLVSFKVKK